MHAAVGARSWCDRAQGDEIDGRTPAVRVDGPPGPRHRVRAGLRDLALVLRALRHVVLVAAVGQRRRRRAAARAHAPVGARDLLVARSVVLLEVDPELLVVHERPVLPRRGR